MSWCVSSMVRGKDSDTNPSSKLTKSFAQTWGRREDVCVMERERVSD